MYLILPFTFQKAFCAYCHDRIWGLGRQGFKCIQCKLLVHKKCHKMVQKTCTNEHQEPIMKERDVSSTYPMTTVSREFMEQFSSSGHEWQR